MPYAGELNALLTAIMWTGSAICFSTATMRIGSVYVNITRLASAILFLLLTIVLYGINFRISNEQVVYLTLSGLLGFVFGDTFLFKSYEYVSARIGSLVMSSSPAIAAVLAFIFLKETLSVLGIIGMCITLSGIFLVVSERKETASHQLPISTIGIFFAFLGSAGQAGGLIFAKKAFELGEINGFVATFIRAFSATIILLPLNYFSGRFKNPIAVFKKDKTALKFTLLGSVFGPYLGVTFSLIAISLTNVAIASTIMALVPILILPVVKLLYHEHLSWRAIVGAFIAVSGVGILFLR